MANIKQVVTFTVVADDLKLLIGRNIFDQLGFAVTQSSSQKGNQVKNISRHSAIEENVAV